MTDGTVGGEGKIFSVQSDGTESLWTSFALKDHQNGPRQMAFSPDGFIPGYGELLFVSVSGSQFGGGYAGDVLAFDSDGHLVVDLRDDLGLTKFDPRGLYFDGDNLIISDASDPIWIATSAISGLSPYPQR